MPRPQRQAPPYDPDLVRARLSLQAGVASRQQFAAIGVTRNDLERLLRRRVIHRLSDGVFCEQSNRLVSPLQRAWWACLHYSRSGLADLSALEFARDTSGAGLTLPIHVAVPRGRGSAPLPEVVLHRLARADQLVVQAGLGRMRPEHAALRVAAVATNENGVVAALSDAVNWRVTKPERMRDALADLPRLPRRSLIAEVLDDLVAGACSVLERGYLVHVERAHGLPEGVRQEPRRTPGGWEFRDVAYLAYGLVVELDGRLFHSAKSARDKDMERDLDDLLGRRDSARLGYAQVFDHGCRTAGKVATLLQQRGWPGLPVPCGPGCGLAP
ncbi:hypothetical protein [Nocardioides jejuensis]|uniref:Type IV toxin-antitoxin system AbiEi family antitoxin domain-containing protein n=1 Tax=Nocardioides jejuensis TaxID=2502782 RepID=A0A4R1CG30_9ACTN|nr:hypothetical protein [Nocardioides jejuensis]TCJ30160.1 hypothetical protein EPD65_04535 [Nocardioides jejuensis]